MNDQDPIQLTRGELKDLLQEAVTDALVKLGMDIEDPIEMQRDFQHLRDWRVAVGQARSKGFLTIVGLLTAGIFAGLWIAFKAAVQAP